jgi:hypothetical protein
MCFNSRTISLARILEKVLSIMIDNMVIIKEEVLKHQVMVVHRTSPRINRLGDHPTSGNNQSGDRPDIYINRSSSRQASQTNNPT